MSSMPEESALDRVGKELSEWAERHGVREAALAKAEENLRPDWSRNGVSYSEMKVVFDSLELLFELDGETDLRPTVTASYSIEYKKPRFRDRPKVGHFRATFDGEGRLFSSNFTIYDDLLHELRRVPKG